MARSRALSARGSFPARQRRKSSWEEGPGGIAVSTVTASASLILGSGAALLQDGTTLVRLRGRFRALLQVVAGSIADSEIGAFGIGIATDQAFGVGVTAVKIPITDQGWDGWLYWQALQLFTASTTEEFGNAGSAFQDFDIDSKAMRKLNLGDTIYGVVELTRTGSATAKILFDTRVLLKLP